MLMREYAVLAETDSLAGLCHSLVKYVILCFFYVLPFENRPNPAARSWQPANQTPHIGLDWLLATLIMSTYRVATYGWRW
jgi:hypothetical protein